MGFLILQIHYSVHYMLKRLGAGYLPVFGYMPGKNDRDIVLLGGFQESVAMPPLSLQAKEGLNIAAGISSLDLTAN